MDLFQHPATWPALAAALVLAWFVASVVRVRRQARKLAGSDAVVAFVVLNYVHPPTGVRMIVPLGNAAVGATRDRLVLCRSLFAPAWVIERGEVTAIEPRPHYLGPALRIVHNASGVPAWLLVNVRHREWLENALRDQGWPVGPSDA